MARTLLILLSVLLILGTALFFVFRSGAELQTARPAQISGLSESGTVAASVGSPARSESRGSGWTRLLRENLRHPSSLILLQLVTVLVATRGVGSLFRKFGQPAVIGEMAAGILLGPSLLGMLSPGTLHFLFPKDSLGSLQMLSQIGVILFMLVVGMETEASHLRKQAHTAVLVSQVSILLPFFLGSALALALYRPLAPPGVSFHVFALFLGVAMSLTAFPVLARILEERNLSTTFLGSTAIACAAISDVMGWCILALIVAIAKAQSPMMALLPMGLTLLFLGGMLFLVRPQMRWLLGLREGEPLQEGRVIGAVLILMLASAWLTETIGIHALFGAFLTGVILPPEARLRVFLRERLALFGTVFLLPLFFASTGLRTQVGLLNTSTAWLYAAAIIAVAIAGKLGGSLLAARWSGLDWPDAFALGSLMNTRGLVELIVLNIGYDMGVLSPSLFAMLVLMALTTTFMTGPLLSLADLWRRQRQPVEEQVPSLS